MLMSEAATHFHPQHRFDYYAIIPHRDEPRLLMLPGWTLPHFTPVETHFSDVGHINRAMRAQFGIRVMTLRCVYDKTDFEAQRTMRVYALDNLTPNWNPPPGAAWLAYTQLDTVSRNTGRRSMPILTGWIRIRRCARPGHAAAGTTKPQAGFSTNWSATA